MSNSTQLNCKCGQVKLEVQGEPFLVSECLCTSCRAAALRLQKLPGLTDMLTSYGATGCADFRKDRVRILAGADQLKDFRLSAEAGTRRVVASCCNTPIFMEMKGGHWLSIYLDLWPENERPKVELRTMVGDLDDASAVPNDVPNLKTHSVKFYGKLLAAWVAMGFKTPKFETGGTLDV